MRFFVEEEVDDVGRGEDAEGLHVVTAGFADDFARREIGRASCRERV